MATKNKKSKKSYNTGGLVREDPRIAYQKEGFSNILSSGFTGGAAGIAGGPAGIAGGAIAGMLGAGLSMALGKEELDKEREDWSSAWATNSVRGAKGYRKGGEVDGKGGPKDDAIQRDVEPGSFIVPAENAEVAKKIGQKYLEWDGDQSAKGHSSGNKVNLSDGEVLFTRDEKAKLQSKGVDLSMLAPKAMVNKKSFQNGGDVPPFKGSDFSNSNLDRMLNPRNYLGPPSMENPRGRWSVFAQEYLNQAGTPQKPIQDKERSKSKESFSISNENLQEDPVRTESLMTDLFIDKDTDAFTQSIDKDLDTLSQSIPDINDSVSKVDVPKAYNSEELAQYTAIAQGIGGAVGAITSGKKPSPVISDSLRKLSSEAIRDAGYGLPESVKNEMRNNSARTFRAAVNEITNKGGSAQDVYNKISGAMSQKIAVDNQVELSDYQEKQRKKQYAGQINLQTDQLKTGLERDAAYRNDAKVAGWMDVLGAGIHNIIGVQQSKDFSDRYREAKDQPLNMTVGGRTIEIDN